MSDVIRNLATTLWMHDCRQHALPEFVPEAVFGSGGAGLRERIEVYAFDRHHPSTTQWPRGSRGQYRRLHVRLRLARAAPLLWRRGDGTSRKWITEVLRTVIEGRAEKTNDFFTGFYHYGP